MIEEDYKKWMERQQKRKLYAVVIMLVAGLILEWSCLQVAREKFSDTTSAMHILEDQSMSEGDLPH